ncbi:MAG: flagellar hook assembly protein FlgD [Pseudomonadota bacterium]|nr:flagellar hook assembly protein FlgD [Pseudomonadota bacterium]
MAISAVQTDSTSNLVASLNGSANTKTTDSAAELSDRFLTLLVTQLKNQDPMNPMDNAEMTSQLAQISTVEGVNNLNATVDGLVSQYKSNQVLQGASLVGRQVLADGDALTLSEAGAAGGVGLETSADSVKIKVLDGNGAVVQTLDLGAQDAGLVRFVWDGKGADGQSQAEGQYTFEVEAGVAGKSVAAATYTLGNVLSVSLNGNDMVAEVSGLGDRGLDQIRQIF